jgi:hypothetical protein
MNERVADVVKFMIQQGEMLRGNDRRDHPAHRCLSGETEVG